MILEFNLGTARSYLSPQNILHLFSACWPKEVKPLLAYFPKLGHSQIQLHYTEDAITNYNFCIQIFPLLTLYSAMISMVQTYRRPSFTFGEAINDLLVEQTSAASPMYMKM